MLDERLAAAVTQLQAGAFEAAAELLDLADAGPLGELDKARISLLRAQLAFVLKRGGEAQWHALGPRCPSAFACPPRSWGRRRYVVP